MPNTPPIASTTNKPDDAKNSVRLSVGSKVDGRYEIIDFLGAGGFARVYRARHVHMGREVAVKMLNIEPDERRALAFERRFLQEAKIAASLKHPSIVTIHDFGFSGPLRQPYIAMELLDGHDLETEIDQSGALEPKRAAKLAIACLEALGKGHRAGVVHKDLKPANLFLTNPGGDDEGLVILDFGVARKSDDEDIKAKLTDTGAFNGTPQYLSPEYIQDQVVTPALDVYQMGLILVEMLTGEVVVSDANPYECIISHCSGDLKLPESLLAGPLGPVMTKALALDPNDRYEDAEAFRAALAHVPMEHVTLELAEPEDRRTADPSPTHPDPPALMNLPHEAPDESLSATPKPLRPAHALAGLGAVTVVIGVVALVVLSLASGSDEEPAPQPTSSVTSSPDSEASNGSDGADRFTEQEREAIDSRLKQTKRLIAMSKWSEARELAEEVLEIDPQNVDAKSYLKDIDAHGTTDKPSRRGFRPGS